MNQKKRDPGVPVAGATGAEFEARQLPHQDTAETADPATAEVAK